ncbi:MAG: hypothetical protein CM1200mP41_26470 [Gammaproteobacteria bacterium]|nr:MAG: hypothetical protein CM1200mP41_26470 [Gammaproteobacteria bacterium]
MFSLGGLESHGDTVDVQLALGTLFRRRGELDRATTVHQNLVAREGPLAQFPVTGPF